jgi:hypothetical protein
MGKIDVITYKYVIIIHNRYEARTDILTYIIIVHFFPFILECVLIYIIVTANIIFIFIFFSKF